MARIGIVGAGPCGLAAAIAAAKEGFEVDVYEKSAGGQNIGAGLVLHRNGLSVLERLGLLETIRQYTYFHDAARIESQHGRLLATLDMSQLPGPHNCSGVIARADLQKCLLEEAERKGVRIHFSFEFQALHRKGLGAVLDFSNGEKRAADIVLACDGVHSPIRQALGLKPEIRFSCQPFLSGITTIDLAGEPPKEIWGTHGHRFGCAQMPDQKAYFFCTLDEQQWEKVRCNDVEEWLRSWQGFPDATRAVLNSVEDWSTAYFDRIREVRLKRWAEPPVFLLGDAAHAMTPNLGQGANAALVDAWILIQLLREQSDFQAVSTQYEKIRKPFVTRTQDMAWNIGESARFYSRYGHLLEGLLHTAKPIIPWLQNELAQLAAGNNSRERIFLNPSGVR